MQNKDILKKKNIQIGFLGEMIASNFLVNKGFNIIERNYRRKWGEIDIIAEKHMVVRFVEVKSVSVADFSRERNYEPEDLVDQRKLRKIIKTAELYMDANQDSREFQIDVVAVFLNQNKKIARCRLIEQALEE